MKKIISMILGLLILGVIFLGALQISRDIINPNVSLVQTSLKYHSKVFRDINTIVNDIHSQVNSEKTNPVDKKETKNKYLNAFLLALSAILINKKTNLANVILILLMKSYICIRKTFAKDDYLKPEVIKRYLLRILQFITPVNKCILNRADQYDIDPVGNILCKLNRTLYVSRV
jgi:hypothetical protein